MFSFAFYVNYQYRNTFKRDRRYTVENTNTRRRNMRCFTLLSVILIPIVLSQDIVDFGDNDQTSVEGSDVNLKTGVQVDEDDVNTRFFNVDLNSFAGQVAASALGTVVGNAGVNLAGNLLNNCNNRGKRSILMHKLEKRQAIEGNERKGNTDGDPEVATRFICPQDLLNPGGSSGNNNGRYCDRCYCSDWDCRRDCRKCGNSGASGWSSSSSSGNNNWGQSSSNHVNCNSCYCSSNSCRNTCRKCSSNNNSGHYNNNNNNGHYQSSSNSGHYQSSSTTTSVSCSSCYCSNYSCKRGCNKCSSSNNSGWNNGGSYNNGWRSSNGVNGRTGDNSGDSEVVASQDNSEQNKNNSEESVVFA